MNKVSILFVTLLLADTSLSLQQRCTRRQIVGTFLMGGSSVTIFRPRTASAGELLLQAPPVPEHYPVEEFLRRGGLSPIPEGISGQSGKSRPETGVILRDGSVVSQDPRNGDVLAEILVKSKESREKVPVLAAYSSPSPLARGPLYDVECRDPKTGDTAFLIVSSSIGGKSIDELKDSFFIENLFAPSGRFSAYGQPTDISMMDNTIIGTYRYMDMSFSTLSQSTMAEIPHQARVVATIPDGTDQVVMLVGSARTLRWKKGSDKLIASAVDSFRAIPAPRTSLKIRPMDRFSASQDLAGL